MQQHIFELYRKYRDDYRIADILAGKVRPETFARIYAAAFDERLSVVNLLLDGLSAFLEMYRKINRSRITGTDF